MITLAAVKAVTTQLMSSSEAPRFHIIWVRDTFTLEVLINWSITPVIIVIITTPLSSVILAIVYFLVFTFT